MKLLVDMNLSPRWTRFLSDAGIEAAHCQTADELDEGALLTVEPNRMRLRLLPLRSR